MEEMQLQNEIISCFSPCLWISFFITLLLFLKKRRVTLRLFIKSTRVQPKLSGYVSISIKKGYSNRTLIMIRILTLICIFISTIGIAQTKKVLFLGNSYTGVNNLPMVFSNLALSAGDTVVFDSNTPGGYTLQGHSTNNTSLTKIEQGDWDFVVLQEQSQLPSFPTGQVETETFPFAEALNTAIEASNPCAETVFYMTWGRENGDASNCATWPPVCTYEGMDSLLHRRYMQMAEMNDALASPVGRVWKYIRNNHPEIDLYASDGSHPSQAGTYAAACAFYSVVFRESPTLSTYNYSLDAETAEAIRMAADEVAFQNLSNWFVGDYDLDVTFTFEAVSNTAYQFENGSSNYEGFYWEIDGTVSDEENPTYDFFELGNYSVSLYVFDGCDTLVHNEQISIETNGLMNVEHNEFQDIYPNPSNGLVHFSIDSDNPVDIKVFDLLGNLVFTTRQTSSRSIDFTSFPAGRYILQVTNDQVMYTGAIMRVD